MRPQTLFCLILMALLFSCNSPVVEVDKLSNVSMSKIVKLAAKKDKGVLLISNQAKCSICEIFDADLMTDANYAESVYKDFVVARIDYNAIGHEWLSQMLNSTGFPVFLVFDKKGDLTGVHGGYLPKGKMLSFIDKALSDKYPVENFDLLTDSNNGKATFHADSTIFALNNLFKARIKWENYTITQTTESLLGVDSLLKASIVTYPFFYNQYMLSKFYSVKKDSINAMMMAEMALSDKSPKALLLSSPLRTELKTIINKTYSIYEESFITADLFEKHIGRSRQGDTLSAFFTITNKGKKNLKIRSILADCECTRVEYPKDEIKPQQEARINVQFKASTLGEFVHVLKVFSDASNSVINLKIKGIVED